MYNLNKQNKRIANVFNFSNSMTTNKLSNTQQKHTL